MANRAELWSNEYGEASRLADNIRKMLSECGSLPPSELAIQRHLSSMIRRMRILSARLGNLEADLTSIPRKSRFSLLRKFTSDKEMRMRQEMLSILRAREQQMASALADMPEDLLGSSSKGVWIDQARGFAAGFDDQRIVSVQRQIMREQDQVLDRLEETVSITKHIALAMNEELNLHARWTDISDQRVELTDSRLQRVQNRLAILNERNKACCSCMYLLLLLVLAIVILASIAYRLLKYL